MAPWRFLLLRLLPRYASGALPAWAARRLRWALARDAVLAQAYDALRRVERLASSAPMSAGQLDLLESLVVRGADASHAQRGGLHWWSAALPAAMAAAALVLFVRLDRGEQAFGLGTLTARGEAIAKDVVGVKVTCVSEDRARMLDTASAGARRRADSMTCPRGSLMAFSTTNLSAHTRHLFVLGIAADGRRRWYAPFGRDHRSVAVRAGALDDVLSPLADTAPLSDEPITLFVLISDAPFSADMLERDLARGERRLPLGKLQRLPVDVPLQARIDLLP